MEFSLVPVLFNIQFIYVTFGSFNPDDLRPFIGIGDGSLPRVL
jgi:hypothetical protein